MCLNAVMMLMYIGEASPIKQHPYWINPIKLEQMKKEIDYMLKHKIIELSNSSWSSPITRGFAGIFQLSQPI